MISANQIILGLLTLGALVILLFLFTGTYNYILPFLKGEEISLETQEEYENRFEKIIENIENCKIASSKNCVCEIFPSFPGTFKDELHFISQGRDMQISLKIGTKDYFSETIEDIFITGLLVEDGKLNFEKMKQIDVYDGKYIDFGKSPPKFKNKGDANLNVASSSIYKDEQEIFYLLLSEKDPKEVEQTINSLNVC